MAVLIYCKNNNSLTHTHYYLATTNKLSGELDTAASIFGSRTIEKKETQIYKVTTPTVISTTIKL